MRRIRIVIPAHLVSEIDRLVGKGNRSSFLKQAAEKELLRLRQIQALQGAAGFWKAKDHSELSDSAAGWVKKVRRENERRLER